MKNTILSSLLVLGLGCFSFADDSESTRFYDSAPAVDTPRSTSHLLFDFSKKLLLNLSLQIKAEEENKPALSPEETMGQVQLLSTSVHELVRCTTLAPEKEASACFTYLIKLKSIGEPTLGEGFMRMLIDPPQSQSEPEAEIIEVESIKQVGKKIKTEDPLMAGLKI